MKRSLQHTLHVSLGFDETCRRIESRGLPLLERATAVAASAVSSGRARSAAEVSIGHVSVEAGAARGSDPTRIALQPLIRAAEHHARMSLDWQSAAPDHRLLPHLDAALVINGVILHGPHASTAVSVLGSFDISAGILHRIDDLIFRRRIVDEATEMFLTTFVDGLMNEPIDLRDERVPGDSTNAA